MEKLFDHNQKALQYSRTFKEKSGDKKDTERGVTPLIQVLDSTNDHNLDLVELNDVKLCSGRRCKEDHDHNKSSGKSEHETERNQPKSGKKKSEKSNDIDQAQVEAGKLKSMRRRRTTFM